MKLTDKILLDLFAVSLCEPAAQDEIAILLRMEESAAAKKFSREGYELYCQQQWEHRESAKKIIEKKFDEQGMTPSMVLDYLARMGSNRKSNLPSQLAKLVGKRCPNIKLKLNLNEACEFVLKIFNALEAKDYKEYK